MRIHDSENIPSCLVLRYVCKQTPIESCSLLFESAAFRVGYERGYERFLSGVSASELNAIQTSRIASHVGWVFARGDLLRDCYELLDPPVPCGLFLSTLLVKLGGLKRVVLESEGRQEVSAETKYGFSTAVKRIVVDRSELVEIVSGADDWLREIGAPIFTMPVQEIRMLDCMCRGFGR
jgi:hypothetical protein